MFPARQRCLILQPVFAGAEARSFLPGHRQYIQPSVNFVSEAGAPMNESPSPSLPLYGAPIDIAALQH
jgi:hypothetical protein